MPDEGGYAVTGGQSKLHPENHRLIGNDSRLPRPETEKTCHFIPCAILKTSLVPHKRRWIPQTRLAVYQTL